VTGALATVDVQDLASNERGIFQKQDGVDNILNFSDASDWMQLRKESWVSGVCIAVFITPGATTLVSPTCRPAGSVLLPIELHKQELHKASVSVVALRQDRPNYFDTHHGADDRLEKMNPRQLDRAVAVWSALTYLRAVRR
jgi:hypothetical protein